jgi:diketogulonate reductase-like aldo/keto reductase
VKLTEDATRRKVIELLEMCNSNRMDMWTYSGIKTGVLDADVVQRVMKEEVGRRSHQVQMYWLGECNCDGHLN